METNQEVSINNWSMFEAMNIGVEIHELGGFNETHHTTSIGIFLDDDNPDSTKKYISNFTNIGKDCLHCCIRELDYLSNIQPIQQTAH